MQMLNESSTQTNPLNDNFILDFYPHSISITPDVNSCYYLFIHKIILYLQSIIRLIFYIERISPYFMQMRSKQDIQCMITPKFDKGGIYISNLAAAKNLETLKSDQLYHLEYNIKSIITIAKGGFLNHSHQDLPNYLYIPAKDEKNFDISIYFDKTYEFIERHKKFSNILVHCLAGISRSVTVIIAYIMKKQKKSMVHAFEKVRKIRPIMQPNEGFICQLLKYEQHLNKSSEIKYIRHQSFQKSVNLDNKISSRTKSSSRDMGQITEGLNDRTLTFSTILDNHKNLKQKQISVKQKQVLPEKDQIVRIPKSCINDTEKSIKPSLQKFRFNLHKHRYSNIQHSSIKK